MNNLLHNNSYYCAYLNVKYNIFLLESKNILFFLNKYFEMLNLKTNILFEFPYYFEIFLVNVY